MKCIHSTRVYNTVLTDGVVSRSLKCGFGGSVRFHVWNFCSIMAVLIRLCHSTNRKSAYPLLPKKHRAEGFVQEIYVKWIHHLAVQWVEWVPGTALELLYLTQPLALQLEIGSGSRGPRELRQLECQTNWAVDPACSG